MNANIPDEVKIDVSVTVCEKCNIVFKNYDNLRQHLLHEHAFVDFNVKPVMLTLSCDNCKKVFTSKLGLKYHLSRCKDSSNRTKVIKQNIAILLNMSTALPFKYFMNRFRCFHCSKDFVQFDSLKEHSVKEHPHCDLKSKSMKFLKGRDISLKIDVSNLSCKVCSENYSDVPPLIDHLIAKHKATYDKTVEYLQSFKIAKDSITCPFCSDVFQYFRKLLEHINLLHSVENFVCAYCGQTFGNNYNYRAHISRYHRQDSVKCMECSTEFPTVHKLSRHKARVHGEKIYQCQQCDDKFGTQYLLKKHAIQAHSSGHKCMYCNRVFTINSHLRNHVRRLHLKEKNFECNICSERFFDKPLLKTHLVKHIDENPEGLEPYTSEKRRKNLQILFNNTTIIPFKWRGKYLCFYCANDYTEYSDLKKHMKSHGQCTTRDYSLKAIKGNSIEIKLDISAIECEICNEPFTSRSEIVDHLIGKHDLDYDKTVETPISEFRLVDMKCQYCEKDFSYFVYLRRHLKLAHSQNNFVCDDCGATFNSKRDLAFHLHNFHKYGGYPCDVCADVFDSKNALKSHKNKNHFRKCIYCNGSFASFSLLQKHIQNDHSQFNSNKCPFCSKKCHSKQGVGLHIKNCKMNILQKTPAMLPSENAIEPKKKQNLTQIRRNIINVLNMTSVVPFKFFAKFSCFYCSLRFTDFEELKQHTASEHPFCDLNTPSIKKCKGERTTVKIDISSLSCRICSQPAEQFEELIDHIIAKHSASYDKSVISFEPFRIYIDKCSCTHCSSVFRYFTTLLRHCNSEHSNTCHVCDSCGRSFKKVSNLTAHIAHTHKGACECSICGIQYRNQWCLNRHNAKCHNAKDFKCPNCPEQFQSPYQRQKHLIKVHDIGHKCSYCGRMFTRNSFMRDHIRRTHLKEKNMECSICGEKFFDNHLLKLHMVKHEGVRKFSCAVCCKSFMRRSNLASHMGDVEDSQKKNEMVQKHSIKRRNIEYILQYSNATPFLFYKGKYRCFFCTEPIKDPDILREHTKIHKFANLELIIFDRTKSNRNRDAAVKIDITNLTCELCTQIFATLEQLIHHLIIAHDAEYDMSVPNCFLPFKLDRDQPTCSICDMKFVFFEYLLRHANKHHLSHDYICDVCGTSFQGDNHLRMHNRYYHRDGGYTCNYCGIRLETLSKKSLHEKNVHLANLLTCQFCPEIFKSPYFKKLHLANVHGVAEMRIQCPYCPKIFPQQSLMSRHMRRVHFREKNVECPICGERFFGPYDVKLHLRKHNGDKNFICTVCGKKFAKKSNLNAHSVVHTGRKDHTCGVCGKEFAHRPNLRLHYKTLHPEYVEEKVEAKQEEIPTFQDFKIEKPERLTSKEKRNIMRNNVLQVLIKSTVMPFRWLKSCYRCFYCYDIFTEPSELKMHQHQHTGDEIKESTMNKYWEQVVYIDISTLSCKLCSDDIPDLYDLINHLVEKHGVLYNKDVGICMIPFKLDNYSLNCLTCGATFYTFGTLLHHTNKDHKGTSATLCEICGQNFKDANLLRLHVKAIHDNSSLLCQECGEKFESRYKLKNHQKYQHELDKKRYKCLVCDETFRSHYKRSRHMVEEHKNREVIKCLHCPKTFVFRSMMMTHLRDAHLKVRNHVCSVCGWKAFTSHRLKNHMYKHSGEKNFRCDGCDKMFTTRKIMKAHFSRMHKGVPLKNVYEEPYQY
ncbi:unnamed protein product [Pieris macdunnoughi]|uniref:C2H2-type domain-containing protein n=1 Tax=Pieris macdunnoughi TaxID=345717 RepID=A0A821UHW5_9NEOP|nr:unnamed protein product [Pieris macdunnoughi]